MNDLNWGDLDAAVWAFAVLLMAFAWLALAMWRRGRLAQFASRGPLPGLLESGGAGQHALRGVLLVLSAACVVLALMRPQHGTRATELKNMGIDIAVVLDASKSMRVPDVVPDRLQAAKLEIGQLLDGVAGGRIALVPFAGLPFIQTPLTSDHQVVATYLDDLRVEDMPRGGTSLGRALIEAIRALVPAERLVGSAAQAAGDQVRSPVPQGVTSFEGSQQKAIVVFTDGEDHEGDPVAAAELAREHGIHIYTVGVGTAQGRPIPIINDDGLTIGTMKDSDGKTPLFSELNESLLAQVAEVTGGRYFHLGPGGMDEGLQGAIDTLEKREYEATFEHLRDDRFQLALLPALFLLLLEALLRGRRVRTRERP